jgi:membrane fusion protein, multidrug efflux system
MESSMELPLRVTSFDRKRLIIPSAIVALLMAIGAGAFFYFNSKNNPDAKAAAAAKKKDDSKEKAPVPVNVAAIASAPISSYVSSTANLVAENEVKIVAEADGRVERLLVEEGVFIQQGNPLATLVQGDAQMLREKANVRARNAKVAYTRAADMFGKGLMSQGDYEKAAMENEVARQELGEANWRLGKTVIRAPFTGRVTERMINQGQHVKPGDPLFTLTDFDPLIARIFLPERDVIALQPGREVRLALRAASDIIFEGRIRQISPVVDTQTGTVKVTVEAVNPPAVVRPGAFVTVSIVRDTKQNAIRIPREAVVRELREAHVFIADNGFAKRRDITLGIEEGDYIEALSGVKPGEKVIVAGQGALKDGSAIKVLKQG